MQMFAKTNIVSILNLPYIKLLVTTFIAWESNGTYVEVKIMFATGYIMPLSNNANNMQHKLSCFLLEAFIYI